MEIDYVESLFLCAWTSEAPVKTPGSAGCRPRHDNPPAPASPNPRGACRARGGGPPAKGALIIYQLQTPSVSTRDCHPTNIHPPIRCNPSPRIWQRPYTSQPAPCQPMGAPPRCPLATDQQPRITHPLSIGKPYYSFYLASLIYL